VIRTSGRGFTARTLERPNDLENEIWAAEQGAISGGLKLLRLWLELLRRVTLGQLGGLPQRMDLQLVNNGGVCDLGAATQVLQNPESGSLLNSGVSDPKSPDSRFQATVTGGHVSCGM
jgi:hypothetical protein